MCVVTQLQDLLTVLHKHFHNPNVDVTKWYDYVDPFEYLKNGQLAVLPDQRNDTWHVAIISHPWPGHEDVERVRCITRNVNWTKTPRYLNLDDAHGYNLCPQCLTHIQEHDLDTVDPDVVDEVLTKVTAWLKTT